MKSGPCEGRPGYLGYVAHELRNPLSTALWCAELLDRLAPEERGGPRGERLARTGHRALTRLSRLLEDHLLAEQLAAGGLEVQSETVRLRPALERAAERAAPGSEVDAPEGLEVRADEGLLVRALEALMAAAGRDGARVRAEARPAAGGAVVAVRGAPLMPEALELPTRGSPSDPQGRSLGLAAAAAAAAAQGASLAVEGGALVLTFPGR